MTVDLKDRIAASIKTIEDRRREAMGLISNELGNATKEIFAKYPNVKGVVWTQYTPYFNDGDECIFGAHIDDFGVITEKNHQAFVEGEISANELMYENDNDENDEEQPNISKLKNNNYNGSDDVFVDENAYLYRDSTDEEYEEHCKKIYVRNSTRAGFYKETTPSKEDYRIGYRGRKEYKLSSLTKFKFEMNSLLSLIPDEYYKELFGDHCKVILWNDGTTSVDEYEHD